MKYWWKFRVIIFTLFEKGIPFSFLKAKTSAFAYRTPIKYTYDRLSFNYTCVTLRRIFK